MSSTENPHDLDQLRRFATVLKKAFAKGNADAITRVRAVLPKHRADKIKQTEALHVVARETGYASWPALKAAADAATLNRAARVQRLRQALFSGHAAMVSELLDLDPTLADADFGIQVALYRRTAVAEALARDPDLAVTKIGLSRPLPILAFSKHFATHPELQDDMLAVAKLLLEHGADPSDHRPVSADNPHPLSALYGAIGHANNMVLGQWLLDKGANPNDGESLYHATELGHHDGLRMLLAAGADPKGTNALLRALDFHDHAAVELLVAHGASADEYEGDPVGGELPWVLPALHQAARRGCDRRMIDLLLDAGADPNRIYDGTTVYGFATVFGNKDLLNALEATRASFDLTSTERLLAQAVDGPLPERQFIDPAVLPRAYCDIVRTILHLPGRLDHVKRLIALGVEYDRPDSEGLTPVQVAGWEGLPEVLSYFLGLKPDLGHKNQYGGTLLSTILHGSENCPERHARDYLTCLEMVLTEGVALPRQQLEFVADEAISAFLRDWAARYPGQVVEHMDD